MKRKLDITDSTFRTSKQTYGLTSNLYICVNVMHTVVLYQLKFSYIREAIFSEPEHIAKCRFFAHYSMVFENFINNTINIDVCMCMWMSMWMATNLFMHHNVQWCAIRNAVPWQYFHYIVDVEEEKKTMLLASNKSDDNVRLWATKLIQYKQKPFYIEWTFFLHWCLFLFIFNRASP